MKFSVPGVLGCAQDKIDELFTLANLLGYQRVIAPLINSDDFIEAIKHHSSPTYRGCGTSGGLS